MALVDLLTQHYKRLVTLVVLLLFPLLVRLQLKIFNKKRSGVESTLIANNARNYY